MQSWTVARLDAPSVPLFVQFRIPAVLLLAVALAMGVDGCKELTTNSGLPPGTPDPTFYNTKAGALGMRNAAIAQFEQVLPQFTVDAGLLTDELADLNTGVSQGVLLSAQGVQDPLDERVLPEGGSLNNHNSYEKLQGAREFANQAIGALATYDTAAADTATAKVLRGELYALEGYAEVMLADLFCSGVPLSTLDFQHDFTYHGSSTTRQVYQDAIAKLDTALALADTSTQVQTLARVGRGRAFLELGQFDSAAAAVAQVPDGFQYQLVANWSTGVFSQNVLNTSATVSDHEGISGLPYRSSGDPRTATVSAAVNAQTQTALYFPLKYSSALSGAGYAPFPVATWVEARLIQAEAALHAGDVATWLATLNRLRTNGSSVIIPATTVVDTLGVTGCTATTPCSASGFPAGVDYSSAAGYQLISSSQDTTAIQVDTGFIIFPPYYTCQNYSQYQPCYFTLPVNVYFRPATVLWGAGTGGVNGLGPLTDPGASQGDSARVALMFQERAYWLFLTGHRQGDLRRLIRQYGQRQDQVYPTGLYLAPGAGTYGTDVNVPISATEAANPLFHGCLNRGA